MKLSKFIKIILCILLLLYLSVGIALFKLQKDFIYYPSNQDFNMCPNFADAQKLNLNGTRIYYKKNSENIIIFYHGNAGSACDRVYLKNEFDKLGLSYAFVEYAGYSNDVKKPSINLLLKDVENVSEFVKGQNFSTLTIAGESLGTSLAIYHSTIALNSKLLLITPFYRLSDIGQNIYSLYPVSLMLTENYDNSKWVKNIKSTKVEIIRGEKDELIPLDQAQKLFDEIMIKNKEFLIIKGAGHNDIYDFTEAQSAILNFLRE